MSNASEHVVIVGAGHAGGALSGFLRQYGFQGRITLVGAETTPPYQRPPLSKAWLKDTTDTEALLLKAPSWYDEGGAALRLGRTVLSVDEAARCVELDGGERIPYDHLVFATGASARRLTIPGADLEGVTYLRDLVDADKIKSRLRNARRLAIVGGGYIGLEVAATARHHGVDVIVLERETRLLSRSASDPIARHLRELHASQGVACAFGVEIAAIEGQAGQVTGIRLADGSIVDCDTVLVGIGAVPNSAIAQPLGIATEGGIPVDSEGRTSAAHVWAIGDVTRRPLAHFPGQYRLESVPSALEQARRVACSIVGRELPAHELPWFWSDQYDAKLQIAGMPAASDTPVLRGDPTQGKFTVFHLSRGTLCAAECVNNPGEFLAAKKAIAAGARAIAERLADPHTKLSDALAGKASEPAAAVQ
ncbi:oxidoreductase [Variovorax paradoxus]|nr:oxidoreductase [Variovorax paradoxus]